MGLYATKNPSVAFFEEKYRNQTSLMCIEIYVNLPRSFEQNCYTHCGRIIQVNFIIIYSINN